jgi:hypothetical protein
MRRKMLRRRDLVLAGARKVKEELSREVTSLVAGGATRRGATRHILATRLL